MSDNEMIWFGMLEAGASSSPVARDHELDTGNPATVYLFNLRRGAIGEYRRDIVEAKLRDLTAEEDHLRAEIDAAFARARSGFTPRRQRLLRASEPARRSEPREAEPDLDEMPEPPELGDEEPLLDAEPDLDDDDELDE